MGASPNWQWKTIVKRPVESTNLTYNNGTLPEIICHTKWERQITLTKMVKSLRYQLYVMITMGERPKNQLNSDYSEG